MTTLTTVMDETEDFDRKAEVPSIQRYAISSFGADYPIDTLYSRLTSNLDAREGNIFIPDFQRGYIWTKPQADKFIESLLLGLPVPGIFLSRDGESGRQFVIDGQQRLTTIKFFMDGLFQGREFRLGDKVHNDFRGRTFKTLQPSDRLDFENTTIHATIVRQEQPENDRTSIYYLFERINTGGTPAQPHEVRRAIYRGRLNDLLEELDKDEQWRQVFGRQSKRLKDQELILRFLALYSDGGGYGEDQKTMKDFLTHFMALHRDDVSIVPKLSSVFRSTITIVADTLGRRAFRTRGALNAAIFDAVMVGIARRLDSGPIRDTDSLLAAYKKLLENGDFVRATKTGTSQQANVTLRLTTATHAFCSIE